MTLLRRHRIASPGIAQSGHDMSDCDCDSNCDIFVAFYVQFMELNCCKRPRATALGKLSVLLGEGRHRSSRPGPPVEQLTTGNMLLPFMCEVATPCRTAPRTPSRSRPRLGFHFHLQLHLLHPRSEASPAPQSPIIRSLHSLAASLTMFVVVAGYCLPFLPHVFCCVFATVPHSSW